MWVMRGLNYFVATWCLDLLLGVPHGSSEGLGLSQSF